LALYNLKWIAILFLSLSLFFCTPKGPQTYKSAFVGKTKQDLINAKGLAKKIKIFDGSEAHIYTVREEYFGKNKKLKQTGSLKPKKIYDIEHIYYTDKKGVVYKYQVWKKKVD